MVEVVDSVVRREERVVERVVRVVDWVVVVSFGWVGDEVVEEEEELEMEGERKRVGEVCVAMSLWKSSVGSESMVSASEALSLSVSGRRCLTRTLDDMAGMWLTFPWSFSFSFSRLWRAVLARSWRDEVRDWSMGWIRCLLAP